MYSNHIAAVAIVGIIAACFLIITDTSSKETRLTPVVLHIIQLVLFMAVLFVSFSRPPGENLPDIQFKIQSDSILRYRVSPNDDWILIPPYDSGWIEKHDHYDSGWMNEEWMKEHNGKMPSKEYMDSVEHQNIRVSEALQSP